MVDERSVPALILALIESQCMPGPGKAATVDVAEEVPLTSNDT